MKKSFYDLSKEDKIKLDYDRIQYYAKLECANRGIIIPLKPISEIVSVPEPTEQFYSFGYEGVLFDNEADANLYAELKNKSYSTTSVGKHYCAKRSSPTSDLKISKYYTHEEAKEMKGVLDSNSEAEKEWKSYNDGLKEYNQVVDEISTEVNELNYYQSRENHFDKIYADYLELAENDIQIAYTFFKKAYANAQLSDVDSEIVKTMLSDKEPIKEGKTENG